MLGNAVGQLGGKERAESSGRRAALSVLPAHEQTRQLLTVTPRQVLLHSSMLQQDPIHGHNTGGNGHAGGSPLCQGPWLARQWPQEMED